LNFAPANRSRIAVLVDLPRTPEAGGHVKWWERLAAAAAEERNALPFDLTIYFSGQAPDETLGPHVRLGHLKPLFSTERLKFLPYTPDHTDLAPFHPRLARELARYDLIHTTDGFFAFARTAERVSRARGIPLTTSFHTDAPAYARIFTRRTIEELFAKRPRLRGWLLEGWDAPSRQEALMQRRLARHLRAASRAFVTRSEDRSLAERILGPERVDRLRVGVDKTIFGPHRRDIEGVRRDYAIPKERTIALCVGRVDVGKNVPLLIEATERAIGSGTDLHLILAGLGPGTEEARRRLADHVSLPGFVPPIEIGRLYASVDFCALPSEVEVGSMAAIEAVASGAPTLVSPLSRSTEQFGGAAAMREVEGGASAWSEALTSLAASASRRLAMREAALECRRRVMADWSDVLNEDLAPGWRAALPIPLKTERSP
jgi:glycosyltransferase involved in cell wall biosynthesis